MAEWVRDEGDYKFRLPGQGQDTAVHITGVMDTTGMERSKLLLENHWDNRGPSVEASAAARDQCIRSLSASMKIQPQDVDWFTRDRDGNLQSVSVGYERVYQQDPQYGQLLSRDDLSMRDKEDAKPFFPDVAVSELRTGSRTRRACPVAGPGGRVPGGAQRPPRRSGSDDGAKVRPRVRPVPRVCPRSVRIR